MEATLPASHDDATVEQQSGRPRRCNPQRSPGNKCTKLAFPKINMSDTTMYLLSGKNTGLHGCREHALGVPGVVRKKIHGSSIFGKSHLPSVLCQENGTTTKGP